MRARKNISLIKKPKGAARVLMPYLQIQIWHTVSLYIQYEVSSSSKAPCRLHKKGEHDTWAAKLSKPSSTEFDWLLFKMSTLAAYLTWSTHFAVFDFECIWKAKSNSGSWVFVLFLSLVFCLYLFSAHSAPYILSCPFCLWRLQSTLKNIKRLSTGWLFSLNMY